MGDMRFVLDTNVIVAGLRSPTGASRRLLELLAEDQFEAIASVAMMLEYEAVLKRPKQLTAFNLTTDEIDQFLDGLATLLIPITPFYLWRPQLRDPADEHVLEAAINGRVDAIVTFNVRHFGTAGDRFGVDVYRPNIALQRIRDGKNE